MKPNNQAFSYYALMNRFWALDEIHSFSATATKLYFLLLHTANKNRWPAKFTFSDTRAAAAVGISTAKLKTARKQLAESGLICVTPGGNGHAQKTEYRISGCDNCEHQNSASCMVECTKEDVKVGGSKMTPKSDFLGQGVKVGSKEGSNVGVKNDPPNPEPLLLRHNKDKIKTPHSDKEEVFDLEKIEAPQDGTPRNLRAMLEKLEKFKATPNEIRQLLKLSNFGQIGHPIWKCFSEINVSDGKIKSPIRFIFSNLMSN